MLHVPAVGNFLKDKTLLTTVLLSLVLIGLTAAVYPYFSERSSRQAATWHMINANRDGLLGEANLILAGKEVVMIDAGQRKAAELAVLKYLLRSSITHIDHFFISEANRSHFGGLAVLINAGIQVENVYYLESFERSFAEKRKLVRFRKYLQHARENGVKVHTVKPGRVFELPGDARITVLDVASGEISERLSTMLLRLDVGTSRVLFSGDIGREYSNYLIAEAGEKPAIKEALSAQYLKMPQPDTRNPTPSAFYDLVNPSYVFAPSAKRYWCTGEGAVAREWTFDQEIPTWVTGSNGSMRVIWQPDEAMILPQFINGKCKFREFGSLMVR